MFRVGVLHRKQAESDILCMKTAAEMELKKCQARQDF